MFVCVCMWVSGVECWSPPLLLALLIKSAIQIKTWSVFTADTTSKLKAEPDRGPYGPSLREEGTARLIDDSCLFHHLQQWSGDAAGISAACP